MTANEIRQKFIDFFLKKGHQQIPSAPLIPEHDPTVLFTTAGMHPLVPYLLGEKHPQGHRLVNYQKCLRTDDIEEVGDDTHLTFFEMLGNWSLGDYFKKEAIEWSFEFLTSPAWLGLPLDRLAVSVFAGDNDAPKDEESAKIWQGLGVPPERIAYLDKKANWWGPAGQTGPCGPDTEMFYWTGDGQAPEKFDSTDARWMEIWNDVFMQYEKKADSSFVPLQQKNVDTGMGLERITAIMENKKSLYETELFNLLMQKIAAAIPAGTPYNERSARIIADHIKTAVFILGDQYGVAPSNVEQGYQLRKLIRRAIRLVNSLGIKEPILINLAPVIIYTYQDAYPELTKNQQLIFEELTQEENKFNLTLTKGLKEFDKMYYLDLYLITLQKTSELYPEGDMPIPPETSTGNVEIQPKLMYYLSASDEIKHKMETASSEMFKEIQNELKRRSEFIRLICTHSPLIQEELSLNFSELAFKLYDTYGFPYELTHELAKEHGIIIDQRIFRRAFQEHKKKPRHGAAQKFAGGLADAQVLTTRLHTATHLLQQALRQILGMHVAQKGSNITAERLRFDFSQPVPLTKEEIKRVEDLVNVQIQAALPVTYAEMTLDEAKNEGAIGLFPDRYQNKVKVYSIGNFSKEICGGPHVTNTKELGAFKILKEESSSSGVRRIKAVLLNT